MNPATLSGPNNSQSMTPAMRASRMLGWAGLAVGAAGVLTPRAVAQAVGISEDKAMLLRACGIRQIATGIGAHSVYPVPALWGRMGGDLADLAILAVAARKPEGGRGKRPWIAMAAVGGFAVVSAIVASRLAAETKEGKNAGGRRDYSGRSGFPGGVEAARGAGIVRQALDGKAGGAAAGDTSPAAQASTGKSTTDNAGAALSGSGSASAGGAAKPSGDAGKPAGDEKSSDGLSGKVEIMPEEAQKVIPEPPSYTPV